jgi:hypothetical protein
MKIPPGDFANLHDHIDEIAHALDEQDWEAARSHASVMVYWMDRLIDAIDNGVVELT